MSFNKRVRASSSLTDATDNDYITASEVNTLINAITLPSIEGLATEDYVDEAIGEIDLSPYVLSSALTTTLANYALSSSLANYVLSSSLATTLSSYVLSSSLATSISNAIEGLASEEYVNDTVSAMIQYTSSTTKAGIYLGDQDTKTKSIYIGGNSMSFTANQGVMLSNGDDIAFVPWSDPTQMGSYYGSGARGNASTAVAIGTDTEASTNSVAIGYKVKNNKSNSVVIGHDITNTFDNTIIIGNDNNIIIKLGPITMVYDNENNRISFQCSHGTFTMNLT
jgi:hypothetical protein